MTDCTGLSADNDRLLAHQEIETRSAVSNTIGSPHNKTSQLKSKAKGLQERLDKLENIKGVSRKDKRNVSNQIKDLKKQLKEEKKRYLAHRDLHDLISNHVLKLSASTGFAVDPKEYLVVLNSMSRKLFNMPLVNMNNATTSTILTFKNSMSKWIDKTTENKKINVFTRSFGDIWKMIATHDRSGLGFKTAEMAATIPDATWNSSFKYLDDHDDITSGIVQNLRNWINSGDIQSALFREHDESYVDEFGDPVTGRTFDEMSDKEKKNLIEEDYLELIRDLMDGRVRYVVPKEIPSDEDSFKEFVKSNDYKAIRQYIKYRERHRFHNVVGKDGKRYTYVMIKQGEGDVRGESYNSYLVQRSTKDEETGKFIADKYYIENGYGGDALAVSGMDEGFWEAGEHRPFNYEMRHSNGSPIEGTNLTSYYLFKRMSVQPNSSIVNEKKKSSGAIKSNNYTIWEGVAKYRSMFENVYNEINKETKGYDAQLNELIKKATKNFVDNMGIEPENAKILIEEAIANGGIEANIWQSQKTGTIYTGNSFMKKAQQNYDPVTYDITTGWGFVDKAVSDLTSEIKQLKVEKEESQSIVEKTRQEVKEGLTEYSISGEEFIGARRLLKKKEDQLKKAKKELSNFIQMREIDESGNAENILKHRLVRRLAHTKHRKPFTNHMLRERDPSAVSKYINNTFKGMHYNKLTLNLLKVLAEVDNPEVAEWLINRVKIATGSLDYNANFLGADVDFRNIADKLNTVSKAFGKKGEWKPEDIHYIGTAYNMYTSSNLLGMWSAVTNNTQRLSLIEEFGWRPFKMSLDIMSDPKFEESDMYKAVQNSGVLDLINHFSDMLMGERNLQPEWVRHKLKPNVALSELQLSKSKFIRQKSSVFDKLLWDVAGLTEKQKTNVKALKDFTKEEKALELAKKRGQLYDVMKANDLKEIKKRIKILNRKLTHEEIGKLASWKLRGMPWGQTDNAIVTFSGGEKDMRAQAAIIGFIIAEDLGYLDEESDIPKYMQQAAVNAARMSVYNTMFGMSLQWLPEGFGGVSKQLLQYKPYTYHEMIREQRIIENFMAGNENALGGFRRMASSFMSQFKQGTKYGDNRDEFANRMVRLLEMRMIPTILTNLVMWSPIIGAMGITMNIAAKSSAGRLGFIPGMAVRGYTSPWVNVVMKTLISGMYMAGFLGRLKEDKERKWWNEVAYLFLPPLLSWLTQLNQGLRAFRPWIPLYDEVVNPVSTIYDELTD